MLHKWKSNQTRWQLEWYLKYCTKLFMIYIDITIMCRSVAG